MDNAGFGEVSVYLTLLGVSLLLVVFFSYNIFKIFNKKSSYKNKTPPEINNFFSISSITLTVLLFTILSLFYTRLLILFIFLFVLFPVYMYFQFLLLKITKGSISSRAIYTLSLTIIIMYGLFGIFKTDFNPYIHPIICSCFLILSGSMFLLFSESSSVWFLECSKIIKDNKLLKKERQKQASS